MEAVLKKTTREDQKIARSSISRLAETQKKIRKNYVRIKIQENEEYLTIPKKALTLLFDILCNMAEGKSITLIPSDAEISTQQAAEILNVSRPFFVKLLEKGEIPFKKVGTHRRVELKDILAYQKKLNDNRSEKLDLLAKQAQELNLGY